MQAIITKYISATNYKPSRVRAKCERGSIILSWDDGLDVEGNHRAACEALCASFIKEDAAKYGTSERNTWALPKAAGQIPDGRYVFVFLPQERGTLYTLRFNGRLRGAIGVFNEFEQTVRAADLEAANLRLYETHDHITNVREVK